MSESFRPSRRLGQNFLIDKSVAMRIIELAELSPGNSVLEVGPGTGALTDILIAHSSEPRVVAVEIDYRLADALRDRCSGEARLTVTRADVLRLEPDQLFTGPGPWVVVSNAPYSISGALLRWLMAASPKFDRSIIMLQSEVVDRLVARPGTKAYGVLTLATQFYFQIERLLKVSPRAFRPRPKVGSSVIRLTTRRVPPVPVEDSELLLKVIRAAFSQRRKTIRNSLLAGAATLGATAEGVDRALGLAEISPKIRAETLSLEKFAILADSFLVAAREP